MAESKVRPVAIDLYSGAGGLSLGLEQAGFDVVLAVDKDPYHVATHRRNFPYGKSLCTSVADLSGHELLKELAIEDGRTVDLICGGPPCQGFSSMGKRYVADPRNSHVDDFARIVVEIRPKAFLMENVPGIQAGETAPIFKRVFDTLGRHYTLSEPVQTLNAADFGVPQRRDRLFLVGIRKDLGASPVYPSSLEPSTRPTVWEAIRDLPPLMKREDLFSKDSARYRPNLDARKFHIYVKTARGIFVDRADLSHSREWAGGEVSGCLRVKHRPDVEALYAATAPGAVVPAHNLPRLDPKGLAPTLRAGTDSEHGWYNAPRPIHPHEPRCITVREAARLHGYPDWFKFYPRKWHAHRQIGNSVCPPVSHALGKAIIQALGLRPEKPTCILRLTEDFPLPESVDRHHKRIPQIEEWPKVLEALMASSGVTERGTVKRATFSLDDVKKAYRDSKATMPRTPPERFLEDIARSRNRRWILSSVLDKGLSILPVSDNGTCGQFVRKGTPGTLEWKNFLAVSSEEVADAIRVPALSPDSSQHSLMEYLICKPVSDVLFKAGDMRLDPVKRNGTVSRAHTIARFEVNGGTARSRKGVVILGMGSELPGLKAVDALISRADATKAIVVSAITKRHFIAVLLTRHNGSLRERKRGVFEIATA